MVKWQRKKKEGLNLRRKKTTGYTIILFVLVIGFFSFLSSKFYMPEKTNYYHTELNKEVELSSITKLTIQEWAYNPLKKIMEVALHIEGSTSEFSFEGIEKANSKVPLDIKIIYQEDNDYVLQIKNVSPNWGAFALKIFENKSFVEGMDFTNVDQKISVKRDKQYIKTIYADQRKTKSSDSLLKKNEEEYALMFIKAEQKNLKKRIQKYEQAIKIEGMTRKDCYKEIRKIEEEMEYLTDEDKVDYESQMATLKEEVKRSEETEESYKEEQKKLRFKIEKLDEKTRKLK